MTHRTTRRTFIKQVGYAGAALPVVMPALVRSESPNKKLNIAFIGIGGGGVDNGEEIYRMKQNCVAFAEVDRARWNPNIGKRKEANVEKNVKFNDVWPEAKGYT